MYVTNVHIPYTVCNFYYACICLTFYVSSKVCICCTYPHKDAYFYYVHVYCMLYISSWAVYVLHIFLQGIYVPHTCLVECYMHPHGMHMCCTYSYKICICYTHVCLLVIHILIRCVHAFAIHISTFMSYTF